MYRLSRRGLLRALGFWGLGVALAACSPKGTLVSEPTIQVTKAPAPEKASATPVVQRATEQPSATAQAADIATPATIEAAPATTAPMAPATAAPTAQLTSAEAAYLAVVHGESPEAITTRAIAALGGIERFVKPGYDVIIKPNICNANHGPEYASTTNPEVVATLVKLCLGAGAKRVRAMDFGFSGSPKAAYVSSGIQAAVEAAGGEMELMAPMKFVETPIPNGVDIKEWPIYQPVLEADLLINVPIAKHHSLARLTLGHKNLMGVIENRGSLHRNLGQRLADLATVIKPQLTVVDAVRILMANGPTGGNLDDVKQANMVIASHDMVAADAYATRLFGLTPEDITYIPAAAKAGLGTLDLGAVKLEELSV